MSLKLNLLKAGVMHWRPSDLLPIQSALVIHFNKPEDTSCWSLGSNEALKTSTPPVYFYFTSSLIVSHKCSYVSYRVARQWETASDLFDSLVRHTFKHYFNNYLFQAG